MGVDFGHQGLHPNELQMLPPLTNRAFDVGCDQRLPRSGCQMKVRVAACALHASLLFQSRRKTTFGLGRGRRSQKAKLIGSA